jgi:antitoxin FitA
MPKMIQLRHVPDGVHRKLKSRAARKGMSLSDYLVSEVTKIAEQPTLEEVLARIRRLPPVELPGSAAAAVRAERDSPMIVLDASADLAVAPQPYRL